MVVAIARMAGKSRSWVHKRGKSGRKRERKRSSFICGGNHPTLQTKPPSEGPSHQTRHFAHVNRVEFASRTSGSAREQSANVER